MFAEPLHGLLNGSQVSCDSVGLERHIMLAIQTDTPTLMDAPVCVYMYIHIIYICTHTHIYTQIYVHMCV